MTLEEIQKIFSQAEVNIPGRNIPPTYTYYLFTNESRGVGSVVASQLDTLLGPLEGYSFYQYVEGRIPVFIKNVDIGK